MNPEQEPGTEPVLLIIADISGYTRYMTANARSLAHSHAIITELVQSIIKQVELPMEVAKLEGDAVFLFCRKRQGAFPWGETRRVIGERLLIFFERFSEKVAELSRSTTCNCNACTNIEHLRLKVVAHSGEALFHRVLNFAELAGVDVIIVHRLLKNSVQAAQYLLVTDAARRDLDFPPEIRLEPGVETYDDIGNVNTLVYIPNGAATATQPKTNFGRQFGQSCKLFGKLWRASIAARGSPGQIAFAAINMVLAPILFPVGLIFICFHALKPFHKPHVHRADGTCCGHTH
jgi:hypothetical protein